MFCHVPVSDTIQVEEWSSELCHGVTISHVLSTVTYSITIFSAKLSILSFFISPTDPLPSSDSLNFY